MHMNSDATTAKVTCAGPRLCLSIAHLVIICLLMQQLACAEEFFLEEVGSGKTYGPFRAENGATITMGTNIYRVRIPEKTPAVPAKQGKTLTLKEKLNRIMLPEVKFRKASIKDATEYLSSKGKELDTMSPDDKRGINILLNIPPEVSEKRNITMTLRDVSVGQVLYLLGEATRLKITISGNTIIFSMPDQR